MHRGSSGSGSRLNNTTRLATPDRIGLSAALAGTRHGRPEFPSHPLFIRNLVSMWLTLGVCMWRLTASRPRLRFIDPEYYLYCQHSVLGTLHTTWMRRRRPWARMRHAREPKRCFIPPYYYSTDQRC